MGGGGGGGLRVKNQTVIELNLKTLNISALISTQTSGVSDYKRHLRSVT